jgi:DNA gyrase/topoisomerase IV subunit B
MKSNDIEIKNDRDHLLLIPEMYIGAMSKIETEDYFLDNEKFVYKKIEHIPALLKIIMEIIDNSIDESIRCNFELSNKISIDMTDTSVRVIDNGRGIPIQKIKGTEMYMPEAAFTLARSGSNFKDKETKKEIGTHGIGSFATNVFSTNFEITTCDGKQKFHMTCKNNNDGNHKCKISESSKQGTDITFFPDVKRFKITKITQVYRDLVRQRLLLLSLSYPKIKFSFNGEKIKTISENNFISMFNESYELIKNEKYFIAITPNDSDDFKFFTYVNGLYMQQGGNHVTHIMNEIISRMREKIVKKYPNIKPGDIRNKMRLIVFFNDFPNPKFNSQTKETLTNSMAEIKEFLGEVDLDKFCNQIYRNASITDPIIEIYKIKEEFKKQQDLKNMSTGTKKIVVEKYLPPIGTHKYFTLCEGDSATGALIPILGRKDFGYLPLRGVPLNVIDAKIGKITDNEEIKNIIMILGIDISQPVIDMSYENVLIASDQDLDGIRIRGLLLTLFHRFTPELLKKGRIKYLKTPMIVLSKKNPEHWFYNFTEYNDWLKTNSLDGYNFKYCKGLGTWKKEELQYIINKAGFESMVETFEYDKTSKEYISYWMENKHSDKRKEFLRGKEFNINKL